MRVSAESGAWMLKYLYRATAKAISHNLKTENAIDLYQDLKYGWQKFCWGFVCHIDVYHGACERCECAAIHVAGAHTHNHLCTPALVMHYNTCSHKVCNKCTCTEERKRLPAAKLISSDVVQTRRGRAVALTGAVLEAGGVEFAHVKLHPDDGKHDDGEEEQQANLEKWNHGFHYWLQHHLQTWETRRARRRKRLSAGLTILLG